MEPDLDRVNWEKTRSQTGETETWTLCARSWRAGGVDVYSVSEMAQGERRQVRE